MRNGEIRDIMVYDLVVTNNNDTSPKKSIEYFIDKIILLYSEAKTKQTSTENDINPLHYTERGVGNRVTFFSDYQEINNNQNDLCFLLYSIDKKGSNASFTDIKTRDYPHEDIIVGKQRGRPESAHIVLTKNKKNRCVILVEQSSKLNRVRVEKYLNFLIDQIVKGNPNDFQARDESGAKNKDGSDKMYKYKNQFNLQGHLSHNFIEKMKRGKLTAITLQMTDKENIAFAEGSYIKVNRQEILLSPKERGSYRHLMETLTEARKFGKKNKYDTAKIVFNAEDNKEHTVKIDTTDDDNFQTAFVEKHRLTFENRLNEADKTIDSNIKGKMFNKYSDYTEV